MKMRIVIESPLIGEIQRDIRKKLSKKYGFDLWHTEPMYQKKYLKEIYEITEKILSSDDILVEIGCGLGDIIGYIRKGRKYGFDNSLEVIKAAKLLHPCMKFYVGSFEKVEFGNIKCLIMVNFLHAISPKKMKEYISDMLEKNEIKYFIFDKVERIKYSEYLYSHDGISLFDGKYECCYIGESYEAAHGAKRHIELWKVKE